MEIIYHEKKYEVNFSEFLLFNGKYEMPSEFFVKRDEEGVYQLKTLSLRIFNNTGKSLAERAQDYQEQFKKVQDEKRAKKSEGESEAPLRVPPVLL